MARRSWMLAIAAAAQWLPGTGFPEQPTAADQLQEVVIAARRRDEPLQTVPMAVSVVESTAVAERDLRSAVDLTAIAPNLQTPMNPVLFSAPTFFIRGVGQGDHNWNTENGVAVFLDDVYLQSTAGAWIDLLDFERIEVLRGPQGTLYGRNSTSGAVKFVPRKPDLEVRHQYAELTFGSRSRMDTKVGLNAPFASGKAAIKIDVFRAADDGYFTRVDQSNLSLSDRISRREHVGARVATLWRPGNGLEFELNGDLVRQDNGMHIITPIVPADPAARSDLTQLLSKRGTVSFIPLYGVNRGALEPLTVGGSTGQTSGGGVFKATFDSSIGRWRSITSWRRNHEHFMSQLGGSGSPSTIFGVTLYGNVDTLYEKVDQFTEELQFTGKSTARLDYTLGAYFFGNRWAESEYGATNGIPANLSPFVMPGQSQSYGGSYNDIDQRTRSWALYVNADWHLNPRLTLTLGARQTWDQKTLYFNTLFEDHQHTYPGFPVMTDHNWNRFTPRISLDWRATESVLLYASFAEGYKVGNIEGARSSVAATAGHWLAPELASSVEAGLKADWLQHRLRTNFAVFASENTGRTDLISPDVVASSDVRYAGLEAEVTARLGRSVELFANLGLLRARYRNVSANHPIFAPDPAGYAPGLDAHPPMTPHYTLSLGGHYTRELRSSRTFSAAASVRAVGKHYHALGINNFDSELVEPYVVADASFLLDIVPGRLRMTLGAHNVLNRTYYANGLFGAIPEFAGRYYADGRTLYLSLKSNW